MPLSQILSPGDNWRRVAQDCSAISCLIGDGRGNLYVADPKTRLILHIDPEGNRRIFARTSSPVTGLAMHSTGDLLAAQPDARRIVRIDAKGTETAIVTDLVVQQLATGAGDLLLGATNGKLLRLVGNASRELGRVEKPMGLALWSDFGTVVVSDAADQSIRAFRLNAEGRIDAGERYYRPFVEREQALAPAGLTLDRDGRLYAATRCGIQVFDPTGRLCGVLARPSRSPATGVAFGGKELDQLYAAFGSELFVRKVLSRGLAAAGLKQD
jgi:enterochelin esterase family protein